MSIIAFKAALSNTCKVFVTGDDVKQVFGNEIESILLRAEKGFQWN